jgi:hypothetical protein
MVYALSDNAFHLYLWLEAFRDKKLKRLEGTRELFRESPNKLVRLPQALTAEAPVLGEASVSELISAWASV